MRRVCCINLQMGSVADGGDLQFLSTYVKTVFVTLEILINAFGIAGNSSILWVIVKDKTFRKPYNVLLGSMAVNEVINTVWSGEYAPSGRYLFRGVPTHLARTIHYVQNS